MTYFADLGHKTQSVRGDAVRAVGWLSRDHEYPKAPTSADFVLALRAQRNLRGTIFQIFPWWPALMGVHRCEFCPVDHFDTGDIVVPFVDVLFVAPSMIVHYVEIHEYLPPSDFIEAVLMCTTMIESRRSDEIRAIASRSEAAVAGASFTVRTAR